MRLLLVLHSQVSLAPEKMMADQKVSHQYLLFGGSSVQARECGKPSQGFPVFNQIDVPLINVLGELGRMIRPELAAMPTLGGAD